MRDEGKRGVAAANARHGLENGLVRIKDSKSGCERLLPLSRTVAGHCHYYVERMGFGDGYSGLYFPSRNGGEKNSSAVYCQFKKFMGQAGIRRPDGSPPRLHGLRHSFSVHALEKMAASGADIYCSLPVLSAYPVHRSIESAEKYLRLTEDAFGSAANPMAKAYQGVFPEVHCGS